MSDFPGQDQGNRYRIILAVEQPYSKSQLPAIAEAVILLVNENIEGHLLAYAKENNVFAQAWYYSRKPVGCQSTSLYFEYLAGTPVAVMEPQDLPPSTQTPLYNKQQTSGNGRSPIQKFNEQHQLIDLLIQYGYKRKLITSDHEKWLSPESSSGVAGITVRGNKFFSHHNDLFNDGYWHDSFDLMKGKEGLSEKDAIIKVSPKVTTQNDRAGINNHMISQWPQYTAPQPLPEPRPAVMPFQSCMLPEAIRDYVFDVADRQQSLPDFVAVAAIVGLSGLLGRKALICPKQLDDWSVTPNQWGAIIGRPSAMKSPSMKEALKPLRQFDTKAAQQFEEDKQNYEEECQLNELEKLAAKDKAKKAIKANNRQQANILAKLQGVGGQKIIVEHVDVHPGGQAVVGNIQGGMGKKVKI